MTFFCVTSSSLAILGLFDPISGGSYSDSSAFTTLSSRGECVKGKQMAEKDTEGGRQVKKIEWKKMPYIKMKEKIV